MTNVSLQKNKKSAHLRLRRFCFCYMSVFIMILFFKNSDAAALWVSNGLELCVRKLIPSLFPFMVISSLIVASGIGDTLSRTLSLPFQALFGISGDSAVAVILGWICGFPVGAKCASSLFASYKISREEYSRLLCICGTPSPAFLISTVGRSMLGSSIEGFILYIISIASAIIVGIISQRISPISKDIKQKSTHAPHEHQRISTAFTKAVSDSALGMLCICAFVVFFSAFLGTLESTLSLICLPRSVLAVIFSFFELTSGLSAIISSGTSIILPLCAAAVGWTGMSVHFQTIAICSPSTNFKPYILSCAFRSLVCALLGGITEMIL